MGSIARIDEVRYIYKIYFWQLEGRKYLEILNVDWRIIWSGIFKNRLVSFVKGAELVDQLSFISFRMTAVVCGYVFRNCNLKVRNSLIFFVLVRDSPFKQDFSHTSTIWVNMQNGTIVCYINGLRNLKQLVEGFLILICNLPLQY